ncbi:biotin--[acetyl-CoA-carboxylase] ligase [Novosphingobium sp. TH158]|uniref:biotin--[acetyl-CoA-carboxylase] ligase n=1 Tax=Novosphingobium sp. TH158 TaxID=2067455 RepID=UPI000C7B551E|nr:biotin--[acetyl-CoA-carboxylase] ligase [Novosphingobium sp. TH158]PLK27741.1 biotin--[acetyl-CoA-carboxylase] ligase [Novosphingobium sp. TH158]
MIETVSTIGSTNAALAARLSAHEAVAEGDWLVADRQSAGKGRRGRTWFDGMGNFMGSTLVHARPGDPALHTLALVAGLSVHEAVSSHLPPPARALLKWPNDVLVGAAKLAGILLERCGDSVVIGIGVNLAAPPQVEGRETIALSTFGPAPDRDLFASALADAFARDLDRWRTYGLGPIVTRWCAAAHPEGTILSVGEDGEAGVTGKFAGLDDQGALLLALPDGTTRTIHAGEVRIGTGN